MIHNKEAILDFRFDSFDSFELEYHFGTYLEPLSVILLSMAINWKNLVQVECIDVNNCYSKSTLTTTEPYTLDQLLGIRKHVEHDKLLQILPSTTCRNIGHLRILEENSEENEQAEIKPKCIWEQAELNTDNLLQVEIQSEQKRIP